MQMLRGHATDLFAEIPFSCDLVATDPPYAFGGEGDEHALSAAVAIALRESAMRLKAGRWMIVMCASSWRSTNYVVESVRGLVDPVRVATWCKPEAKTKTRTAGWKWASVNVVAFRKGKSIEKDGSDHLDHILCAPVKNGRRAELPPQVADWVVAPFAVEGGLAFDPFAGSGALLLAAERAGMRALGFEKNPEAKDG